METETVMLSTELYAQTREAQIKPYSPIYSPYHASSMRGSFTLESRDIFIEREGLVQQQEEIMIS